MHRAMVFRWKASKQVKPVREGEGIGSRPSHLPAASGGSHELVMTPSRVYASSGRMEEEVIKDP